MAENMIYRDVFKCSNCGFEMDENYIGCPKCKEFGTIQFVESVAVGPCDCEECKKSAETIQKHVDHPFYYKARNEWEKVQNVQIMKGAEKYPEPFTPSSWTNEQLAEHAIQENVDQLHYIVGMKERMEEQAKEIERLNKENENQLHYINSARKDYTQSVETIDELRKEIRQLYEDAEKLKANRDYWKKCYKEIEKDYDSIESENRTLKGEF